jgi:hypothetical protein
MTDGGPLYQYIEFCRSAKTLWHKLESGHWDWLGRKPNGQFVLGRPRREGLGNFAIPTVMSGGAKEGRHGIRVYAWSGHPNPKPGSRWVPNAEEAKVQFEKEIERLQDPSLQAVLARVVLIQNGQVTDERFIEQTPPPNYQ